MKNHADPLIVNVPAVRLRVRRINEFALAARLKNDNDNEPGWHALVKHGGSVCNSYGWRAATEAALAVRDPAGRVTVWMARLPANKVTLCGSAEACIMGAGALFDNRVTSAAKRKAAWTAIKAAWIRATGTPEHLDALARLGGDLEDELSAEKSDDVERAASTPAAVHEDPATHESLDAVVDPLVSSSRVPSTRSIDIGD